MSLGWALIHLAVAALGSWAAGRLLIGRYWQFEHKAVQAAAETATGLCLLSCVLFSLAVFHLLGATAFRPLLAGLALTAVAGLVRSVFSGHKKSSPDPSGRNPLPLWAIPFLLYAGWIFACACLPPSDRDELIYHLEIPKQFLAHGGLFLFPDNIYGYFPQLGEMLFSFGMGSSGEIAARLYHALAGGLLGLALYGYARTLLTAKNSFLTVVLFLSVPAVLVTFPLAYVDLIFSLYAFLALIALLTFFKTDKLRWSVLSGFFAGACIATKYTGIQVLTLLICLSLLEHLRERRKGWPLGTLVLTATALPVFLPYLWRNWLLTGWPLFPFPVGSFSLRSGINWDPERARLYLGWLGTFGAPIGGQTLWHILFAPVLVFIAGRFNDPVFYEGVLGPVFLLTPFLLILDRKKKPKEIQWLVLFSLLFLYYWAFTTKQSRFLIPALPVLSYLLVYGLAAVRKKLFYFLTAGLILFNFWTGIKEITAKNPFPFWFGRETREQYLSRQLPVYPIYQEINKRLGPSDRVYLINMKNYLYDLSVPARTDLVFERYSLDRALRNSPSISTLNVFFRDLGITHLAIDEGFIQSPDWGMEPAQLAAFRDFLIRQTEPLARDRSYALYRLKTAADSS